MARRQPRLVAVCPPGLAVQVEPVEYIAAEQLHELAAASGILQRWPLIVLPTQYAARLNQALNYYAETARSSAQSANDVKRWRGALARLARATCSTIGNPNHERWVAEQLQMPHDFVGNLRDALDQVASRAERQMHDPGKRNWAKWMLFHRIAPIYEEMHGANFSIVVPPHRHASSGAALTWVQKLFCAAATVPGAATEIRDLAMWGGEKAEGLATWIRDARGELERSRLIVQDSTTAEEKQEPDQRGDDGENAGPTTL